MSSARPLVRAQVNVVVMDALSTNCIFAVMHNAAAIRRKDMNEFKLWLGQHPNVVIALIASLTIALVAAMAFHYDLSWIPSILRGLVGWR